MTPLPRAAAAQLDRAERSIAAHAWGRASLAPGRARANDLLAICSAAARPGDAESTLNALADGVAELSDAQVHSFPGNLCCDLDYVVAQALRRARARADPAAALSAHFAQLARLQRLYGRDTAIHFRYVHDFVYGFDWAKWVGRDPDLRAHVGPFDRGFLDHLEARGHELLDLIAADDHVYGQISDEQTRNPFPFSREPADELTLHRDLAARDLVPVAAWDPDARPTWHRPYTALRVERAAALGLALG